MNIQELKEIRDRAALRMGYKPRITVNMGTSGITAGAEEIYYVVRDELHNRRLEVELIVTGSIGMMDLEPIMEVVTPEYGRVLYPCVTSEKARAIVANHIANNRPLLEWAITK